MKIICSPFYKIHDSYVECHRKDCDRWGVYTSNALTINFFDTESEAIGAAIRLGTKLNATTIEYR